MEVLEMAYLINDDCISCGACESECPVNCITEGEGIYIIDPNECIDCGACADVCPVDSPKPQ
jgi:ferredoxin